MPRSKQYVAYHSVETVGAEYRGGPPFRFKSKKPRAHLQGALGNCVWVIVGKRGANRSTAYRLAGWFTPTELQEVDGEAGYLWILGIHGEMSPSPTVLNELDWFQELRRQQGNFGFGVNAIRDETIIAGLERTLAQSTA